MYNRSAMPHNYQTIKTFENCALPQQQQPSIHSSQLAPGQLVIACLKYTCNTTQQATTLVVCVTYCEYTTCLPPQTKKSASTLVAKASF